MASSLDFLLLALKTKGKNMILIYSSVSTPPVLYNAQ